MVPFESLHRLVTAFEELKISYFITGSVAAMMYGEPRFTNDVDVVADIREKDIPKLHQYFSDKEYYFDEVTWLKTLFVLAVSLISSILLLDSRSTWLLKKAQDLTNLGIPA